MYPSSCLNKILLVASAHPGFPTEFPFQMKFHFPFDWLLCRYAGQVGYMFANMKNASDACMGDTIYHQDNPVPALPGFKEAKPMVFAGLFPGDQTDYSSLKGALEKLLLNDSSVQVNPDGRLVSH